MRKATNWEGAPACQRSRIEARCRKSAGMGSSSWSKEGWALIVIDLARKDLLNFPGKLKIEIAKASNTVR